MESDQYLQALRRAYADVILNTSREAAARVMAAERKAQQFEAELQRTKDDTVRVMVRLKKKMDDAISEANLLSRNKQQKIDELEAQLHEAEDVVTELREKIRYEEAKSDGVAKSTIQHLDQHTSLEFQKDSLVDSYKKNPYLNQRTESQKSSSEPQTIRNLYGAVYELPSIIHRSKKHNLSRNACTQKIHACERNILGNELSLSRQQDGASNQGNVEGAKEDTTTRKVTFNEVHKMFSVESKELECSREPRMRNLDGTMLELPSIIRRSKKHDLSRSACTQRILACERNILGNELSLSTQQDGASNQGNVEGAKEDITTCKVTFNEVHMFSIESKEVECSREPRMRNSDSAMFELPSIIRRSKTHNLSRKACAQRIQACERNILGNELSLWRQPDGASNQGNVEGANEDIRTCKITNNEVHKMCNIESKEVVGKNGCISCCYEVQPTKSIPKEVKTATKHSEDMSAKTNFNDNEGDTEKLITKGKPPVISATKYKKYKSTSSTKTTTKLFMKGHENPGVPRSDPSPKSVVNNAQPKEDPILTMQELSSDEGMETRLESAKATTVDEPIIQPMLKTTDASNQGSAVQYFKHTFRRKQKRETASISDEHVSGDNHTPERRKRTQIASAEPTRSSLVADSSFKSRQ